TSLMLSIRIGFAAGRRGLAQPTPNSFLKPLSEKPWLNPPSSFTTTGRRTSCGCSRSSSFHSASLPGDLRLSGSWRQVVEDLLTRASKPPALPAHSTRVSGEGLLSRESTKVYGTPKRSSHLVAFLQVSQFFRP